MTLKVAVISGLILSASCMVVQRVPVPTLIFQVQSAGDMQELTSEPNYNFAYEVNDFKTGDVKSQSESRKGDTVFGQYTLIQPDGVRRTVEYKADDRNGFSATVNNDRRTTEAPKQKDNDEQPAPAFDAEILRRFLEENKIQTVAIPRSHIIQSIQNLQEPFIATILHR